MFARFTTWAVVVGILAAVVAGCGDDEGGETGPSNGNGGASAGAGAGEGGSDSSSSEIETSSLTKARFVKQANAICRRESENLLDEFGAYVKEHEDDGKEPDVLYADMVKEVFVPTVEAEVEKVRALGAPKGDKGRIEAMLDGQEEAIEAAAQVDSVKSLEVIEDEFKAVDRMIRAYGLSDCTNSADPSLAAE